LRLYIRDANGTVFSVDDVTTMQISLEMSSQASDLISVIREDALNYRIRGVTIGTVTLSATVRSASQHELRSVEHEMQVFAPLRLLPEMITLVPESQFQGVEEIRCFIVILYMERFMQGLRIIDVMLCSWK
uniref:Cadherin domain-containing protein n=1 Tax=Anisakis simplex TaxID=6269 RepID=A0A0M3JBM7_ANISI